MKRALITGGAGFFGTILRDALLKNGWEVVSVDLMHDTFTHPQFTARQGDISEPGVLEEACKDIQFDVIFHLAAILTPAAYGVDFLWKSNVEGTRRTAECAVRFEIPKVIYLSTVCVWGSGFTHPVAESEPPNPIDHYGKSKWEGEKILAEYTGRFDTIIFRCPPVIDAGRLGLLAILFEFIDEGRKVWVVGGGDNTYQLLYGADLADACLKAVQYQGNDLFHIGSDSPVSFRTMYESVAARAGTGARVASLPRALATLGMNIAYALGISPLGPYQTKLLSQNFVFDTTKIKEKLGWRPTLTNAEMLWKSYEYYRAHKEEIHNAPEEIKRTRIPKMGIIRVLKWLS
jgi:UDP-glucose 4-epimerase